MVMKILEGISSHTHKLFSELLIVRFEYFPKQPLNFFPLLQGTQPFHYLSFIGGVFACEFPKISQLVQDGK